MRIGVIQASSQKEKNRLLYETAKNMQMVRTILGLVWRILVKRYSVNTPHMWSAVCR